MDREKLDQWYETCYLYTLKLARSNIISFDVLEHITREYMKALKQ